MKYDLTIMKIRTAGTMTIMRQASEDKTSKVIQGICKTPYLYFSKINEILKIVSECFGDVQNNNNQYRVT